ncbi:MAG TPA: tryptophan synthase subunit alpha [Kofleriaceae bacterium]|nr:tryptophan synthase subunit alpha [Kofleriaceae bacterium]
MNATRSLRRALLERDATRAVVGYLTLGDPDRARCRSAAIEAAEAGCVALELGLPTADAPEGAVLARSHARAAAALDPAAALALAAELARDLPCPVVLVGYHAALPDRAAVERLCDQAADAGLAAALIVGLPLPELGAYAARAQARGIETVLTVSGKMPPRMRERVYRATTGAVYVVARGEPVHDILALVASESALPRIVGGGISTREQAALALSSGAHAIAVGAALVERLEAGQPLAPLVRALGGTGP